ncbi:23056_t:CDS:2, partial [Rhizophagus irregularis]
MSNNTGLTWEEDANKILESFYKEFANLDLKVCFLEIKTQEQFKSLVVKKLKVWDTVPMGKSITVQSYGTIHVNNIVIQQDKDV